MKAWWMAFVLVLPAPAAAQQPGGYQVSSDHRSLTDPAGKPFFWLGDTAWTICVVLDRADVAHYLDVRAAQGFTVIQIPAVMSRYIGRANTYGDKAFVNDDMSRPDTTPGNDPNDPAQYDYWDHVDYVVDAAAARGLTVGFLPFFVAFGPGWDYLSPANADGYGRFIGKRYGSRKNVIWLLGGDDKADTATKRAVWDTIAKAIAEEAVGSEDYSKLLMTYHSPGGTSSSIWFHDRPWLDFNMIQTWSQYTAIQSRISHDYGLSPAKPTGLGEGAYENGPEYPTKPITAHVIRKQAWWSYLSGGYHTYGNTSIWNFGIESYYSMKPWKQAMTDPGALHVSAAAGILKSMPWWRLVPDQSVFASGVGSGATLNVAARSRDGDRVVAYLSGSVTVSLRMDRLVSGPVKATWADPKTGARSAAGEYPNSGAQDFTTPAGWEDAVLILEIPGAVPPPPPPGSGSGLRGEYFDNADLSGFAFERTDASIDFDWGTGAPDPSMGPDTFSIRWSGRLEPLFSELHTLTVRTDDGVRLWVDGVLLVDAWVDQAATAWSGTLALQAGVPVDIVMEYYENGGEAVAQLRWSSASTPDQIIPATQLVASGTAGGGGAGSGPGNPEGSEGCGATGLEALIALLAGASASRRFGRATGLPTPCP